MFFIICAIWCSMFLGSLSSEVLKIIGICPIVAPDELCRQGAWKEFWDGNRR